MLDSQPSTVPLDDDSPNSVAAILRLIHSIPQPVTSRGDLYATLAAQGVSQAVAWWLGSALAPDDRGQLRWAFNIQGAGAMFHSYRWVWRLGWGSSGGCGWGRGGVGCCKHNTAGVVVAAGGGEGGGFLETA